MMSERERCTVGLLYTVTVCVTVPKRDVIVFVGEGDDSFAVFFRNREKILQDVRHLKIISKLSGFTKARNVINEWN